MNLEIKVIVIGIPGVAIEILELVCSRSILKIQGLPAS